MPSQNCKQVKIDFSQVKSGIKFTTPGRFFQVLAVAISAVFCVPVVVAEKTQPKGEEYMTITKKDSPSSIKGPDDWFTGAAWVEPIKSTPEKPSQLTAARVTFEAGARTHWHKHPLGQLLIVTDGVGWTQVEGEAKVEFHAGDVMSCPKDNGIPSWIDPLWGWVL